MEGRRVKHKEVGVLYKASIWAVFFKAECWVMKVNLKFGSHEKRGLDSRGACIVNCPSYFLIILHFQLKKFSKLFDRTFKSRKCNI